MAARLVNVEGVGGLLGENSGRLIQSLRKRWDRRRGIGRNGVS